MRFINPTKLGAEQQLDPRFTTDYWLVAVELSHVGDVVPMATTPTVSQAANVYTQGYTHG